MISNILRESRGRRHSRESENCVNGDDESRVGRETPVGEERAHVAERERREVPLQDSGDRKLALAGHAVLERDGLKVPEPERVRRLVDASDVVQGGDDLLIPALRCQPFL